MAKSPPLGELLRVNREKIRLDITQAAQETGIRELYIRAFEQGSYQLLVDNLYTRQYLKRYCELLGVSYDLAFDRYLYEYKHFQKLQRKERKAKQSGHGVSFIFPYHWFIRASLLSVSVVVISFLGYRLYLVTRPPDLRIILPQEQFITTSKSVQIIGQTQIDAYVFINGERILTDQDGRFQVYVNVREGLNEVTVSAKRKHSKEQVVRRQIIVKGDEDSSHLSNGANSDKIKQSLNP